MLQLSGAAKRFGERVLFSGLDWLVTPQDRVGLVGGNGSGKTTLLKILADAEPLDGGERASAKGVTIGYLPQDGLTLAGRIMNLADVRRMLARGGYEYRAEFTAPASSRDIIIRMMRNLISIYQKMGLTERSEMLSNQVEVMLTGRPAAPV